MNHITKNSTLTRLKIFNRLLAALIGNDDNFQTDLESLIVHLAKHHIMQSEKEQYPRVFESIFDAYGKVECGFAIADMRGKSGREQILEEFAKNVSGITDDRKIICVVNAEDSGSDLCAREIIDGHISELASSSPTLSVIYL